MPQFTLPDLPYAYDALEPHMSAETLEYHHDKHHQTYVDKANDLIKDSDAKGDSLEEVVKQSFENNKLLFNNAAQHFNHQHFWQWMTPDGGGEPPAAIGDAINNRFGSFDDFKKAFVSTGAGQFGSGWVWLAWKDDGLTIMGTPNAENPLVHGGIPLLGCDVWEHSYYIDYRNRRPDYLTAFLEHLVNWEHVKEQFALVS